MEKHDQLHSTLRLAAQLLDNAAVQVRDLPLNPSSDNVTFLAEAMVNVFQVMHLVEAECPSLANHNEKPTHEVSLANRRLGEAFLRAEALSIEQGNTASAQYLEVYASNEPLRSHKGIALAEARRYKLLDSGDL